MAASDGVINLDEPMSPEDEEFYGEVFLTEPQQAERARRCPEGLFFKETVYLTEGPDEHLTEYRCELPVNHEDWHIEGQNRWNTY